MMLKCVECDNKFIYNKELKYTASLNICSSACLKKFLNSFCSMNYDVFKGKTGIRRGRRTSYLTKGNMRTYALLPSVFPEIIEINLPDYENFVPDIRGRSHLEDRVMMWLKDNKFKFLYEPIVFKYKHGRTKNRHSYVPDFLIVNTHMSIIFLEMKGRWESTADMKIIKFKEFTSDKNIPFFVLEQSIIDRFVIPTKIGGLYW